MLKMKISVINDIFYFQYWNVYSYEEQFGDFLGRREGC